MAPRMRPSLPEDTRTERRSCVSERDTARKEDEATLTDSESNDGDCVVMRKVVTQKLLIHARTHARTHANII